MPIRAGDRPGLGGAVKVVADKASSIVRLELALAAAELKKKIFALGVGIALLVGAALFGVFALAFGLATIAAALATVFSTWLALLIVTGSLFVLVGALAVFGIRSISKGSPPVPEQAIAEAKLTTEALKNGKHKH
jgi:membrane protein implicated in regulation of membrane protease activity